MQAVTRSHHDLVALGIEADDEQRLGTRNPQAAPLADRVVDDAVVAPEPAAVHVHDIAGLQRARLQALDHARVAAGRHEADVLAVGLFGHGKPQLVGERAHVGLAHAAEREPQVAQLLGRGGEQEIALVALGVGGARELRAASALAALDVVPGRQHVGAEILGRLQQIAELDLLIAGDARDRRLAGDVALSKAAITALAKRLS